MKLLMLTFRKIDFFKKKCLKKYALRQNSKVLLVFFLFFLCLFFCHKKNFYILQAKEKVIEKVLVIVNDEIITLTDFLSFKRKIKNNKLVDDIIFVDQDPKEVVKHDEKVIQVLIHQKIIDSEIKKKGIEINEERVNQHLNNIAKNYNITKRQLINSIKDQGVSFDKYREFLKKRLARETLIETSISQNIKISEEEITEYYLKNFPGNDKNVFEYQLSHIFFDISKNGENEALKKAKKAYDQLNKNASFEELARKYSEDLNFSQGGFLGFFKMKEMSSPMQDVVKNLKVGEYSKIVKIKQGVHIFKLLGKKLITDPKFKKIKAEIRNKLTKVAFKKQFENWLEKKKESSFIKINI